ncbi:NUDIX hydrolase N-terminal domain-containing protein [Maribacter sp. HTCC2170]|uniref:NUDIX hydrolase N-terminal domain-containing protein n=1 Tax=Maribacter sp. (strain HTCC2170 / KCCM 42371) TaxID=313603 RepID=UPI00006BD543|nr:NUDIX hydrolase [Maribacter sp. HTCC2170]EAR03061.1 mutator MutT protein [Maribacter sp. HTCC2170]
MKEYQNLELIKRIKALADTGLVYAKDDYDKERYEELRGISLELLSNVSDQPLTMLNDFFMPERDYPTAKVDVRGFVMNDKNEILMAKEQIDGHWTIPGGWADVGYTPSEVVTKEIEEETGLSCSVVRLLAIYDKRMHPHPPQPFYVYKLVFLCKVENGGLKPGFDMAGAAFYRIDDLPELSKDRILESQINQLYNMVIENDKNVHFD